VFPNVEAQGDEGVKLVLRLGYRSAAIDCRLKAINVFIEKGETLFVCAGSASKNMSAS
jgi:hypothetical protein